MRRLIVLYFLGFLTVLLTSCFSSIRTIDSREPHFLARREGGKILKNSSKVKPQVSNPKFFTHKKVVKVVPLKSEYSSGSLYNLDDKNNHLFLTFNKPVPSDFLLVKIVNHKVLKNQANDDPQTDAESGKQGDELDEEQLIKSLPSLEPADLKSKGVMRNIRMKVMHQYINGDLLLSYNRNSTSDENSKLIKVKARLPRQFLQPEQQITTDQLAEVEFEEVGDEEVIKKSSTSWEDEYTLRISGFSEAESKEAAELDVKRRELMDIKEQLGNRLKSLGSERRQMAKERDKWIESNKQADKKLAEANEKLEEQKQQLIEKETALKEKNAEIEALTRPEDKPENNEAL